MRTNMRRTLFNLGLCFIGAGFVGIIALCVRTMGVEVPWGIQMFFTGFIGVFVAMFTE